ncbi:MAG TPA: hypothetical protein VFQ93_12825 [Casimicrobiaceae bacterium]|nr:hypothetical protein [Casimicrobiaceae bacterium]
MAAVTGTGMQRRVDWPVAPGDPDAWLPVMPDHADVTSADAVIESIEESDVDARFVPDWSDESFLDAA